MTARSLAVAIAAVLSAPSVAHADLTIYSSLPITGVLRDQTRPMANGARLALAQAGGKAGGQAVRYVSLDSSGISNAAKTKVNARRAAREATTIGYIGEFSSLMSKFSIPILNTSSIAQVSPTNTYNGLTRDIPGSASGEPGMYYPLGVRTYARLQPHDGVQAAALVAWMRAERRKRVVIVHDGSTYGSGLARNVAGAAAKAGIAVIATLSTSRRSRVKNVITSMRRLSADALAYGGTTDNGAGRLFRATKSTWRIYAGDGVAETRLTRDLGRARTRFRCTFSGLPLREQAGGRAFITSYRRRFGGGEPDPNAIYGYEAMRLLLESIDRAAAAGPVTRQSVAQALLTTPERDSPLGRYGIDQFGDTTSKLYGGYIADRRGALRFSRVLDASGL